jgi:hypothetical protein
MNEALTALCGGHTVLACQILQHTGAVTKE